MLRVWIDPVRIFSCHFRVGTYIVFGSEHPFFVSFTQVYTRYRFLQRETRWKGLEDSLDECIDESMRTLDQVRGVLRIHSSCINRFVYAPAVRPCI